MELDAQEVSREAHHIENQQGLMILPLPTAARATLANWVHWVQFRNERPVKDRPRGGRGRRLPILARKSKDATRISPYVKHFKVSRVQQI
jgi:hypothetical protein